MGPIEVAAIIVFVILLIMAVIFLLNFYICDNGNCKAFRCAEERGGEKGSFEHLVALLGELGNDGVWCFPFIGATIMTIIVFWFLEVEFSIRAVFLMWFVCFVVNYILFSFYNHHYLKPLAKYVTNELLAGRGCKPDEPCHDQDQDQDHEEGPCEQCGSHHTEHEHNIIDESKALNNYDNGEDPIAIDGKQG